MTTEATLNKESEKAINVTMTLNGFEPVTTWLPKSSARMDGNKVVVKQAFWARKQRELRLTPNAAWQSQIDRMMTLPTDDSRRFDNARAIEQMLGGRA